MTSVSPRHFLDLITRLGDSSISVDEFCYQFTQAWMQYRDEVYKQQDDWDTRHDLKLIEQFQSGHLDAESFTSQWEALYTHTLPKSFRIMIDKIHSSCSAYSPEPEVVWEIDENTLKSEVFYALADYQNGQ